MRRRPWIGPVLLGLALFGSMTFASGLVDPTAICRAEDAKDAKETKVAIGGDLRLRGEGFDNILDLTDSKADNYTFYRMRPRLWVDAHPREGLRVYLRLTDEYRWGRGERTSGARDADLKIGVDNAYADVRIGGSPLGGNLNLRFGRQDLMYGEGFLVWDGTPSDGSSTACFDAAVLSWTHEQSKSKVDMLMSKIAETGFAPGRNDEDFFGLYAKRDPGEFYVLYRDQRAPLFFISGADTIVHPERRTTAIGARYARLPETGLHFAAEGTFQTGDFGEESNRGFGGYARGGYTVTPRKLCVELAGVYLSGDDPKTRKYEGWDGFYSEWPKYSEGTVYTMYDGLTRIGRDDAGTWTNMTAYWVEGRAVPMKQARVSVRATKLLANEKTGPGTGKDRGFLVAGQVNVDLGAGLTGQVLGEYFDPGDFYAKDADWSWYGRWQLIAKF
jgi:hypothetical protein